MAIGVDGDQNNVAPDTVLTSAVKGIVESTYLTIKEVLEGTIEGGRTKEFGIKENSTGIAPFHGFDSVVPQEVKDAVNKAVEDMKAGRIKVSTTRAEAGM